MSFSSDAKIEIASIKIRNRDCAIAAISAFVSSTGSVILEKKRFELLLRTESLHIARWITQIIESNFDVQTRIDMYEKRRLGRVRSFGVHIGGEVVESMLGELGILKKDGMRFNSTVSQKFIQDESTRRTYMRAFFLGAGSISNPIKSYHLEIVHDNEDLLNSLMNLINYYDLNAKIIRRRSAFVIYLKESGMITQFLALIGAHSSMLKLEEIWVYKDLRNTLNRQVNCETANLQKTALASVRHINAINKLKEYGTFDELPLELIQIGELRVDNPSATLVELGEMLEPVLGKSGVNHRLKKIEEISNQLE